MFSLFVNHKYADEAGVTIRLFFPGAKISRGLDMSNGLCVVSELRDDSAYAEISQDGNVLSKYAWPLSSNKGFLTYPRMLILALFYALQDVKPTYAPWGALTGIRPTKLVREWLDSGLDDCDVVSTLKDPYCVTEEKAKLALEVAKMEEMIAKRIIGISDKAIGFYINIPFCATRCHYCSFSCMDKPPTNEMQERYVDVLAKEIKEKVKLIKDKALVVSSIYIGGGTPTFLPENLLVKILLALEDITSDKSIEFTVEGGRPDSVTKEKMSLLKKYGVNRFCVNSQTLNDNTLLAIGRKHTSDDFFKAFQIVRDAGIECVSTDVIAGLPKETLFDMERTISGIVKLTPENITVHNLAIKRASKLKPGINDTDLPIAETVQKMLVLAQDFVKNAGYKPYYLYRQKDMVGLSENVGYSKSEHWCHYNVGMMSEVQTVIGVGAGAVSKFVDGCKITREFNVKNPEIYVARMVQRFSEGSK